MRAPSLCLAAISLGFVLVELLVVTPRAYLSWDEALYVSQFSTGVPAMGLDAHRSLGTALLVAPVAAVTTSVSAIRVYLSLLTGVGLFLAYRPWLRYGAPVAPLAALLFASLSVTLTNGNAALPNLFVALAAVAGAGSYLVAMDRPGARRPIVGLVAAFAAMSLLRPTDAVWVAVPPLAAAALPAWRRRAPLPVAAIVAGLAVGGAVWVAESYVRFGGPLTRLAMMREITGAGTAFGLVDQLVTLGRTTAGDAWDATLLVAVLKWAVLAGLPVLGVLAARRTSAMPASALAVVTAWVVGGPYLLFLSYPSGRYLLPSAALLAVPAAGGIHWALASRPRGRPGSRWPSAPAALATAGVLTVLVAHVGSQLWAARAAAEQSRAAREASPVFAERLHDRGVRPPCFVSGSFAPQIAYGARCSSTDVAYAARLASVEVGSWEERHPEAVPSLTRHDMRIARADGRRFVVVARSAQRPRHLAGWPRVKVLDDRPWYAYFPPSTNRRAPARR